MKINHNISAKLANLSLRRADDRMKKSLERLSSGYKINSAADDAAGVAISARMHTQIRGLERASQNAADGVSLIQTAEGAMNEVATMLQRMRELSVQAVNSTNTLDDRKAMQEEIEELKKEINRVSTDTEFNQKTLLDGSCNRQFTSSNIHVSLTSATRSVGAMTFEFDVLSDAKQAKVEGGTMTAGPAFTFNAANAGSININGETITVNEGDTMDDVYTRLREVCDSINISCVPLDGTGQETSIQLADRLGFTKKEYGKSFAIDVSTDNPALSSVLGLNSLVTTQGEDAQIALVSGFNPTATVFSDGQRVTVTDRDGFEMIFKTVDEAASVSTSKINILNAGIVPLQIGTGEEQVIEVSIPRVSCETLGISMVNVCTEEGASRAISLIDDAVSKLSSVRAQLGAYQNRLESAISSLDTGALNVTEALTRIEDTDMAKEMQLYTQYNVLLQAGTSMLAQANSQPQQILQLLR